MSIFSIDKKLTIELGDLAKDRITGFEGVVEVMSYWLNSCCRVTLRPTTLKDGLPLESRTFDSPQVEVITAGYFNKPVIEKNHKTGGVCSDPVRPSDKF